MICKLIDDILDYSIAIDGIHYAPFFMMLEDLLPIVLCFGALFGFGWSVARQAFSGFVKLIAWLWERRKSHRAAKTV